MTRFKGPILVALGALAVISAAREASATATAAVQRNNFTLHTTWGVSDGVNVGSPSNSVPGIEISVASQTITTTKTLSGNASLEFTTPTAGGSGNSAIAGIGGTAIADPAGYAFGTMTYQITFAFTNLSGIDLDFLTVHTGFSAFNSGGPAIGARVGNTTSEFARFSSSQTGRGIGDSHQCDTRLPPGSGNTVFAQPAPATACGVSSPDFSEQEFSLVDFDQGETLYETFILYVTLEAQSVPEPAALGLLGAALAGFACLGGLRRRSC